VPLAADLAEKISILAPSTSVSDALKAARGAASRAPYLAVCEGDRLRGLVRIASFLEVDPRTSVEALMEPAAAVVEASDSAERAAWLAGHGSTDVVAVADAGRFIGLIPASSLLSLMVREHEVDIARLGGFLRGTSQARTAGEEAVARRVWHRLPWLLLGLLGAVLAAKIVSSFESELTGTVALAFFLPGIVYMADAVGTQTETLVIRGLSVGVQQARIFRLEALTGAVIGVLLSLAIFPLALLVTGETDLATVVSLALLASAATATVVAVTLPSLMDRLRFDPAFGSGPLATVIQDVLSILIYFGIAAALL
jgi:magnesium transporter